MRVMLEVSLILCTIPSASGYSKSAMMSKDESTI
jgi:hypothetical protein